VISAYVLAQVTGVDLDAAVREAQQRITSRTFKETAE